jgi:flagellar basal body-associated protein FliL
MSDNFPAPVITTKNNGNNKYLKIALGVFGIVLLVIISEAAYFFYNQYNRPSQQITTLPSLKDQERTFSSPSPTPTKNSLANQPITINTDKLQNFVRFFNALKSNKSFIQDATISLSVSGTIVRAFREEKVIDGVLYQFFIEIDNKEDKTLKRRFTEKETLNAYVILVQPDGNTPIKLTDLRPGDHITLKETTDLLDPSPHSSLILEVRR